MAVAKRAKRAPARKSGVKTKRKKLAASAVVVPKTPPPVDSLVIYIHGIGRHKAAAELKVDWDIALFGSDQGAATRMAYWSDIVHPPETASTAAKRVKAAAADDGDIVIRALRESGVKPTKAAIEYGATVVAQLGAPAEHFRGAGKKVLPLPGFLRRPIAEAVLKQFIGDSAAYFFDKTKREAIRARFKDVLPTDKRPITVVAHSQGSVVAVEVLSKLGVDVNVVKLVTIGSPLGLQEVQDFLDVPPKKTPFHVPAGIEQWQNFADPLDPVALDKELRGEFRRPTPNPSDPLEAFVMDTLVLNEGTRRLAGFNPHSAIGYLAHPKVRRAVYDAAQRDIMARFVVARDVAEGLSVQQRHPLIIELLEPGYWALGEDDEARDAREAGERREGEAITLARRVEQAARDLERLVRDTAKASGENPSHAVAAARIDPLRRFVAARLTPDEIRQVAIDHRNFNVYAVWKSSSKRKLITRSRAVLQADAALESYGARGRGIVWAVLDTGVRADHPHFTKNRNIVAVWDCTRKGAPQLVPADRDVDGHGSHVAGIVAGDGGNGRMGVAPEARLVVYKVLNDRGEGEDAWIIKALDHIAAQNENAASQVIHGINLSLGGPYDSTVYGCGYTPICQELRRQWRAGVMVVVASGNEGQLDVQTNDGEVEINTPMSIGDPANLEDCVAVGSVNADRPHLYGVSPFSSRGPTSDGRMKPDVVAPGERITSVNARHLTGDKAYRVESGTSMAAPHVSGLLAAFLSARREFRGRPDEVKRILLDSCTDIGRDRYHQGRGIPNLMKMLLSV
jgi:pimeloyl-ACP methyl ester carboxylesterase